MRANRDMARAKLQPRGDVTAVIADDHKIPMAQRIPSKLLERSPKFDPLPALPAFSGPPRGHLPVALQGALKNNTVPLVCWECGKALVGKRRRFCSNDCAKAFPLDQVGAGAEHRFTNDWIGTR
jgi:hypothetical protein